MPFDHLDHVFVRYDHDELLGAAMRLTQEISVAIVQSIKDAENHTSFIKRLCHRGGWLKGYTSILTQQCIACILSVDAVP